MTQLSDALPLGGLVLENRLVRSATHEGMADAAGSGTAQLEETLKTIAEGGVGLVLSGHAFVLPEGRASKLQLGVDSDERIPSLSRLAQAVHAGGSRFVLQLAHAGAQSDVETSGLPARGPSDGAVGVERAGAMNAAEIARTIDGFIRAAQRAKAAGCDGVQVHSAHGYLLSSFLSPAFNRRYDEWGGSLENRSRMLLAIVKGIREACGPEFPILVKINSSDFIENGFQPEEMVTVSGWLEEAGVVAVEMSGGTPVSGARNPIRMKDKAVWYEEMAIAFRKRLSIPLILVGGVRDRETAERLLEEGVCDAVALSRPLIREPDLPRRWMEGEAATSRCVSCNRCFVPIRNGEGVSCLMERKGR